MIMTLKERDTRRTGRANPMPDIKSDVHQYADQALFDPENNKKVLPKFQTLLQRLNSEEYELSLKFLNYFDDINFELPENAAVVISDNNTAVYVEIIEGSPVLGVLTKSVVAAYNMLLKQSTMFADLIEDATIKAKKLSEVTEQKDVDIKEVSEDQYEDEKKKMLSNVDYNKECFISMKNKIQFTKFKRMVENVLR